jgi:hypothetical protein
MPKEGYSKLQVGVVRPLNMESFKKKDGDKQQKEPQKFRDPRFDNLSGALNEGMFKENYDFVFEGKEAVQQQRFDELKQSLRLAKKQGMTEDATKIRLLLGEEKTL